MMNGAHPSTSSGRAEDRAGHGEPAEPLNGLNDLNGPQYSLAVERFERIERAAVCVSG